MARYPLLAIFSIAIVIGLLGYAISSGGAQLSPKFTQAVNIPNTLVDLWVKLGNNIYNTNIGNVGIGTRHPQEKLEVDGNALIDGMLIVKEGLQLDTATKPPCNEGNRGTFWLEKRDTSDILEVCKFVQDEVYVKMENFPIERHGLSCVRNSGTEKIYCFGGKARNNQDEYSDEIFEYDPDSHILQLKDAVLPTKRAWLSCAEDSETHKIYCFGGRQDHSETTPREIIEYNPATDIAINKGALLPEGVDRLSCAENSATHLIYCFGGNDYSPPPYKDWILEYDPSADSITVKSTTLPSPIVDMSCLENSDTHLIYCFGGSVAGSGITNQIIEYDPATDDISGAGTLPYPVRRLSCAESPNTNKIYCFGGEAEIPGITSWLSSQIIEYDPVTGMTDLKTQNLPMGIEEHSCSGIASGRIYCFGGVGGDMGNKITEYLPIGYHWVQIV